MEPIQTNNPVVARAYDFAQEAKHKRELEQETAAKTDNSLNEQFANRVTFSQEAQIRLNEEKTHVANEVNVVREAAKAAVAEERRQDIVKEHQQAVEARSEAQQLRQERDVVARERAVAANKVVAHNLKQGKETVEAVHKVNEKATANALELRAAIGKELKQKNKADDFNRTREAQAKETTTFLEKQKGAVIAKNKGETDKNNEVAVEHLQRLKALTARGKAEIDKATRMYQKVEKIGKA